MTPDSILQFLRDHPEFLEANAAAIAKINIPHPDSGRAISINERQLLSLRERCRHLETQLAEWIEAARGNDARSDRMHRLVLQVLAAAPEGRIDAMLDGLRHQFDIPWVHLAAGGAEVETLADQPGAATAPGCGPVSGERASRLAELAGQSIGSVAWVPLDTTHGKRVLMLGSAEAGRFPADSGTQYLQRLGEMLKVLLDGAG
jgi:uncharacterized protein YigA (DUF484 family)